MKNNSIFVMHSCIVMGFFFFMQENPLNDVIVSMTENLEMIL